MVYPALMRRKTLGLFILTVLGLFLYLALPGLIRAYVERSYPVKVDRVVLGWPVRFYDVRIVRDGLDAHLAEVQVSPLRSDPIIVVGGTVRVIKQPGQGQKLPSRPGREVVARGLQVEVEYQGAKLKLTNASVFSESYAFETGSLDYQGRVVTLTAGSASKDLKAAKVAKVEVLVTLPFELPKIPGSGTVKLEQVKVNIPERTVTALTATYGPVVVNELQVSYKASVVEGSVQGIRVDHPWIAVEPVVFPSMTFHVPWPLSAATFQVGAATIRTDPLQYQVTGDASCGDWLTTLPEPLPSALQGTASKWKGRLKFDVRVKPPAKIHLEYDCKYDCSAEPVRALQSGEVTYQAYDSQGALFSRTVGRHRPGWTDIINLPPHVTKAVITLEDPGFLGHRGVIVQALQNSLKDNIKLGEFFRGGSTITQQLAKNLWLRRHKTLSRKVHEALLAMAIESCLSKEEILELYLNVVEFGPDLYGIGPASKRYFDKEVGDLMPDEGFYLAALLPRPSKAVPPDQGGLEAARRLMRQLIASGFLPDSYLMDATMDSSEWTATE